MAPSHWTVHSTTSLSSRDARADDATLHSDLAGPARDFDALADIFMGGHSGPTRREAESNGRPESSAQPSVELVSLGHLPVRAAPWASQYCRALADQGRQTVAFVRLSGGVLSIDLFEPGASAASRSEIPDAAGALAAVARSAAHVVIEAGELVLSAASDRRVARVTVITGAHEAAMVAAYRTFKGICAADDAPRGPHTSEARHKPRFQIAVMGAPRHTAEEAIRRVRQTSALFLWSEVALSAVVERVGPTGAKSVYRGPGCQSVGALLDAMRLPEPAATLGNASERHLPHTAPTTMSEPVPAECPALWSLIGGLEPLPVRCPDEPAVEFAWDADHSLHLLRDDADGRGLVALTAVAAWARKHAALIAMATGRDPRSPKNEAALHLFTSNPRAARPLLDASVRVHLLARADAPWFCADLN